MKTRFSFKWRVRLAAMAAFFIVVSVIGAVFWERVWSWEVRELNDSLCKAAQREDMYAAPAHHAYLELDIQNKLQLLSASDVMVRVDAVDATKTWQSDSWVGNLDMDAMRWDIERLSEFDRQYQSLFANRPNKPTRCEQLHLDYLGDRWYAVKVKNNLGTVYVAARGDALWSRLLIFFSHSVIPIGVFLVVLMSLVSMWLVKVILAPIRRIEAAMQNADKNYLKQEAFVETPIEELNDLIASYNQMLIRVRASLLQSSRFSADAAHELKTPLTILQGKVEAALVDVSEPGMQRLLIDLQLEITHLAAIVRKLLLLSQADSGALQLDKMELDWSEFIESIVHDSSYLTDPARLSVSMAESLTVSGDRDLLVRLCQNLLTNAVRYSVAGTLIYISAKHEDGFVVTRFRNSCMPLSAEQRAQLFERFYRAGTDKRGSGYGSGLGLSLAREIARAHGGDLVLENTESVVVEFKLILPSC